MVADRALNHARPSVESRIGGGPVIDANLFGMLTAGLGLLLFSLAAARAARVPLTYDEAASYMRYIVSDPLSAFNFAIATNHLLNTLMTKVAYWLAGDSEFVLRLPNLLAYAAYLWFSQRILRRLQNRAIGLAAFMLLNLNPYILDYFALSRGYGLSLALLMGTIYFLLRSVPLLRAGAAPGADLSRALLFAGAATMANFSLANVFIALVVVLFGAFVLFDRVTGSIRLPETHRPEPGRRAFAYWWCLAAAVFTALVLSQDLGLSRAMYEPVIVRLPGVSPADLDALTVSRIDVRGRRKPLSRHGDEWRLDPPEHAAGLRIEPADRATTAGVVDVMIGNRSFRHRRISEAWHVRTIGSARVLESSPSVSLPKSIVPGFQPVINWRSDAVYSARLAQHTAIVLLLLAALALLLKGLGWLLMRPPLVTAAQWRVLASAILSLAALMAAPIYLLKRESELYFGGNTGLIEDTYYSVIDGSFYGITYHSAQTRTIFALVLFTVAAAAVVTYVRWRRGTLAHALPALGLLSVLVLVSISEVGQRVLFDTPYLLGRTALFFIPLYLLFVALVADSAAALGQGARAVVVGALSVALCLSIYHFAGTFNLTRTWDWPEDACTKGMIEDVDWVLRAGPPERSEATLAVDWMYYPVAVFYAGKVRPVLMRVDVGPIEGADFVYMQDRNRPAVNAIKRYPACRAVLLRGDRRG